MIQCQPLPDHGVELTGFSVKRERANLVAAVADLKIPVVHRLLTAEVFGSQVSVSGGAFPFSVRLSLWQT